MKHGLAKNAPFLYARQIAVALQGSWLSCHRLERPAGMRLAVGFGTSSDAWLSMLVLACVDVDGYVTSLGSHSPYPFQVTD